MSDSDISVRRKIAFLLNGLLLPSAEIPEEAPANVHGGASTAVAPHPSDSAAPAPVHANTHASMLSDPKGTNTADKTLEAFKKHGILSALVQALVSPTPHGPDGETEGDLDLEEKIVRYVLSSLCCQP